MLGERGEEMTKGGKKETEPDFQNYHLRGCQNLHTRWRKGLSDPGGRTGPRLAGLPNCPGNRVGSLSRTRTPGPLSPSYFLSSLNGSTYEGGLQMVSDMVGFSSHFLHSWISGGQRLEQGEWGVTAGEHRVSFWGAGNVLKLVLMVA